jgi:serpin B
MLLRPHNKERKEKRMTQTMKFLSWGLLVALLVGCMPGPAAVAGVKPVHSEKPRIVEPQLSADDQSELSSGNTAFALDLFQVLNEQADNLFFSPYSISLALAMTYGGARGDTAEQMASTLHFTLPPDRLHPAFNATDQALASRKENGGQGADGKGFRFNIVNDLWGQQDYTFQPEFLDLLSANYGAGLRLVDFKQDPEKARLAINEYIESKPNSALKIWFPRAR